MVFFLAFISVYEGVKSDANKRKRKRENLGSGDKKKNISFCYDQTLD